MNRAEFILEASPEGLVNAFHIQKRLVREAEADLRRFNNAAKTFDDDTIKRGRDKAAIYVREKQLLEEIRKTIAATNAEQRKARDGLGKKDDPMELGVKTGRNYREVANQVAYGLGDIMSVQGGLAEMIRASANNVQYMAAQIPGAVGKWAMFGAVAAQAVGMVAAKTIDLKDKTEEAAKAAVEGRKAYKELADEVIRLKMTEDEREKEAYRVSQSKQLDKSLIAHEKAKADYVEQARQDEATRTPFHLRTMEQQSDAFWRAAKVATTGMANLVSAVVTGGTFTHPLATPDDKLRDATVQLVATRGELIASQKENTEALKLFAKNKTGEAALKQAEGMKNEFVKMYTDMISRGKTMEEAKTFLAQIVSEGLVGDAKGGADKVVEEIVKGFQMALASEQFKNNIAKLNPAFGQEVDLKEQLRVATENLARFNAEARSDSEVTSAEKGTIRQLEMEKSRISALIQALEMNTRATEENNRKEAGNKEINQGQILPPLDPQGNQ